MVFTSPITMKAPIEFVFTNTPQEDAELAEPDAVAT
jgi:hypothetical protein